MRLAILYFALIYTPCFGQNKDYSKYTKEEFIVEITKKDKEYKEVKDSLQKLKATKEVLLKSTADSFKDLDIARQKIIELKQVIKDNNDVFLRAAFTDKYTDKYFLETDLELADNTEKFRNSNTLINSVKIDADERILNLSNKALAFNKNYLSLFEIRQSVLNLKFDDKKVKDALILIDSLPQLDINSNLLNTRLKIVNLLKNYKENTCLLKKILDNLKLKPDQKVLSPLYSKYEKESRFENYNYLINIISKMKKDVNSYTSDLLQPCEDSKITTPEIQKAASQEKTNLP